MRRGAHRPPPLSTRFSVFKSLLPSRARSVRFREIRGRSSKGDSAYRAASSPRGRPGGACAEPPPRDRRAARLPTRCRIARVKKTVLVYGILGGLLIALLQVVQYRFLILEHSLEIYGGIVALLFSTLGIWLGLRLTRAREVVVVREVPGEVPVEVPVEVRVPVQVAGPFTRNAARLAQLGITPRELEILEAMAAGLSNREIAERLYVSENTVKTHAARLFDKLDARRRTQAVQCAREAGLIP